ncbi:MAG: hypothetical protein Q4G59_02620 [Planctomycetia bacterium]|nr:hypothetical protein [Planctomycetia bacterium]
MNTTDDRSDRSFIDEALLPYAPPALIDEKPIALDEKGSPLDYREIAAILNRALVYHRKYTFWGIISFLFFALAMVIGVKGGDLYVFSSLTSFIAAFHFALSIILLLSSLYFASCRDFEITQLKKKTNYPKWSIFFLCVDPEKRAVRLLKDAGFQAKYHAKIDMAQFDSNEIL